MSGVIWSKFFWSDWESDPSLRLCSLAAQGLWMRMLCVAAHHDPIGFVCISGRPLAVTDLARLASGTETEADALVQELDRNGVFSRDRHGRIYCRRMVKEARVNATARNNGKKGGNPNLCKGAGISSWDKGGVKAPLKPQSPRASTRVEEPQGSSNPGGAAPVDRPPGGRSTGFSQKEGAVRPPERRTASASLDGGETGQRGLAALRAEVVGRHGEAYAKAWLDPADWCEAERAVVCRLGFAADRLNRDLRKTLKELGVSVRVGEVA